MSRAATQPEQFSLLLYTEATVCKEKLPELVDLACLPSLHRPQGMGVVY